MEPAHFRSTPRSVTVAATQFSCDWNVESNIAKAERAVREAAKQGAQIILLPELFETPYFCIEQDVRHLSLAQPAVDNRAIRHFQPIAKELGVVLPISFFERSGRAYFNSVAILDADGTMLGIYRKSHIPNGPGYQEKNYFSPGDTGFKVWDTRFARIGVGICWDQWFPETARSMALMGAELLFFPTAIGTEPPPALPLNSREHWQRTQQGHAVDRFESLRIGAVAAESGWALYQLLRLVVHRRCDGRESRGSGGAGRRRAHCDVRSGCPRAATRQLVRVPRSAARLVLDVVVTR